MSLKFDGNLSWEEYAASLPKNANDTDRLLHAVRYCQEYDTLESTDVAILRDYYQRARWKHPINLAATANHCASRGWLSEAGRSSGRKLWRIIRTGYSRTKTISVAVTSEVT